MSTTAIPEQLLCEAEIKALPPIVPLIVGYGMGWDSTAMLVEFHRRGIVPDLIMFADTGDELPDTYAYLPIMNRWLNKVGFPQITVVALRNKYQSLYESCMATETLPSLAFRMKTCSQRWKGGPQNKFCNRWERTQACWKAGLRAVKCIGYDAGNRDTTRYCETLEDFDECDDAKKYILWCPLIEWGLARDVLPDIIMSAGLPLPIKSACSFCPARKKVEILEMAEKHPHLAYRAVLMERNWRSGKHDNQKRTVKGLGQSFSWEEFLGEHGYYYPEEESEAPF